MEKGAHNNDARAVQALPGVTGTGAASTTYHPAQREPTCMGTGHAAWRATFRHFTTAGSRNDDRPHSGLRDGVHPWAHRVQLDDRRDLRPVVLQQAEAGGR
jgi:hypothetical protein